MFFIAPETSSCDFPYKTVGSALRIALYEMQDGTLAKHPGRAREIFLRGRARLGELVDQSAAWERLKSLMDKCESPIERELLAGIVSDYRAADLEIAVNQPIGRRRPDMVLIDLKGSRKYAIECDGAKFHTDDLADAARDEELVLSGLIPVHVRGSDIHAAPIGVADAILNMVDFRRGR